MLLLFVEYQAYVQKDEKPKQYISIILWFGHTDFEVNVTENIPRTKVGSNRGHKKNVERILEVWEIYTTSRDNLLMMYSRRSGQSGHKSVSMPYGPSCIGRFLVTNNRGKQLDTPFYIRSYDSTISMYTITDPNIVETTSIKQEERLKDNHGFIKISDPLCCMA